MTYSNYRAIEIKRDGKVLVEAQTFRTEDHREAARVFVEKRPPKVSGR